ncbi:hypothetical protein Hanom_Chr13g01194461 [Helianthus anomalus]
MQIIYPYKNQLKTQRFIKGLPPFQDTTQGNYPTQTNRHTFNILKCHVVFYKHPFTNVCNATLHQNPQSYKYWTMN